MCGIAGWIDFKENIEEKTDIIRSMGETLAPRGPDENGMYISPECGLVHRRLVVIDRENGRQPMRNGSYVMVYNGELYNTGELRAELERNGRTFSGHSDTEVLLAAFVEWGESCLDKINGIFAFTVWNEESRTLFLARDRAGVKPLFYHVYSDGIIFGSEVKALLESGAVRPAVDREGIASVMLLGPARKPDSGVFRDIKSLAPGECAFFGNSGLSVKRYWSLKAESFNETPEETARHLRWLITDSIERQLVSDVPLCTFLSGGLDSSIISAVAARRYLNEGRVLNTFSVDYKDNRRNFIASQFQPDEDAPWIVRMSRHIGSRHGNVEIDTPQLADALYDSVRARDCAGMADVDSSLYLFCGEVKKNFAVALSGECADELFGGYPWYRSAEMQQGSGFPWAKSTVERSGLLKEGYLDFSPVDYVAEAAAKTVGQTDCLDNDSEADRKSREMFMLNFYWFMQTLLERKDRCSMAHGLEVRVPFCDHRIVSYAYNIPASTKFYGEREKGIVRKAFERLLPFDVAWRKKSPYPKTHNPDYLALVIRRFSEIISADDCRLCGFLERKRLLELIETEGTAFGKNWYGQLMTRPQMFAYLIQLEAWLRLYRVELV